MPSSRVRAALLAAAALACGETAPAAPQQAASQHAAPAAAAPTLLLNGLLNSGFELVADSTTTPPKYGAYWPGAFSAKEGDASCLVVHGDAFRGDCALRLSAGNEVLQKIVADPRFTGSLRVSLALRCADGGALLVALEDGPGTRVAIRIGADPGATHVTDADGHALAAPDEQALDVRQAEGRAGLAAGADDARPESKAWRRVSFDLGALFTLRQHAPPEPRLNLHLSAAGPGAGHVDVDEVTAEVRWPAESEPGLRAYVEGLVRDSLAQWFDAPERGGLGLVDPQTGYVIADTYDVVTGARGKPETSAGFHTIHTLLVLWLQEAHRRGLTAEVARWTPVLQRIVRTVLDRNFDPETGLPRNVMLPEPRPQEDVAVAIEPWVDFLLDAREVVGDDALAQRCLDQARRIADTLIALQAQHDLPPDQAPPLPRWNEKEGRLSGDTSEWFGNMPDRLTPRGAIETDKRFYTSWAILTHRTFWYELLRSPRAVARVHALAPKPGDLPALHRALGLYHRDWDAARYDLENDTDDHYGYLSLDALEIIKAAGAELPEALALLQSATDHRLPRGAGAQSRSDDTLWIQAVRLGTACAGDSSRAFFGPLGLSELPAAASPETAGLPLYADAILELARNDLQGRQLTNAQFTESFFKLWEMVCICFKGKYQGDCREHPADWWNGDVGDTFGGPPTSAIDAQQCALRVAPPAGRAPILAALALIRDVTDAALRRQHGWLFGLDEKIARQYELPDKYVIGLSSDSAAGLGYVMAWMRLLPHLSDAPPPQPPAVELLDGGQSLRVRAAPGSVVRLLCATSEFPARRPGAATRGAEGASSVERSPYLFPVGELADDRDGDWPSEVHVPASGEATVARAGPPQSHGVVTPLVVQGGDAVGRPGAFVRY